MLEMKSFLNLAAFLMTRPWCCVSYLESVLLLLDLLIDQCLLDQGSLLGLNLFLQLINLVGHDAQLATHLRYLILGRREKDQVLYWLNTNLRENSQVLYWLDTTLRENSQVLYRLDTNLRENNQVLYRLDTTL